MPYLFEPYNAYQKPPKKKHWLEEAEEEALFYHLLEQSQLEQQFLEQQKQYQLLVEKSAIDQNQQQNLALVSQHVPPSSQQVQDASTGLASANGAAGGTPSLSFFREFAERASFIYTLHAIAAPTTASFTNTTPTPNNDTFLWTLSSSYGKVTSTAITFPTTVLNTGSYTMTLVSTSSLGHGSAQTQVIVVPAPTITIGFTASPLTASAPFTESFTNTTSVNNDAPVTYRWLFGDGTTSALANPLTHAYNTGSFTIRLEATTSYDITASVTQSISGSAPNVISAFTFTTNSNVGPTSASFTNASIDPSQTPHTTYLWLFGDGTTSTAVNPNHTYNNTGSYTASLQVTGSYGLTDVSSRAFSLDSPTVTPNFTVTTSSNIAPLTASFTNTSTNTLGSNDSFGYRWVFGDGTTDTVFEPTHIYNTGSFNIRLELSESFYGIKSAKTLTGGITASTPTLTAAFTLTTSSITAPSTATFLNTLNGVGGTQYDGHGTLTYDWRLGTASLSASTTIPNPQLYTAALPFTVSLSVTESSYNRTSFTTRSFRLS